MKKLEMIIKILTRKKKSVLLTEECVGIYIELLLQDVML